MRIKIRWKRGGTVYLGEVYVVWFFIFDFISLICTIEIVIEIKFVGSHSYLAKAFFFLYKFLKVLSL